jgi:hypothetical protein
MALACNSEKYDEGLARNVRGSFETLRVTYLNLKATPLTVNAPKTYLGVDRRATSYKNCFTLNYKTLLIVQTPRSYAKGLFASKVLARS